MDENVAPLLSQGQIDLAQVNFKRLYRQFFLEPITLILRATNTDRWGEETTVGRREIVINGLVDPVETTEDQRNSLGGRYIMGEYIVYLPVIDCQEIIDQETNEITFRADDSIKFDGELYKLLSVGYVGYLTREAELIRFTVEPQKDI